MKKIIVIVVVILVVFGIFWLKTHKRAGLGDIEKDRFAVTLETVQVRDLKLELLIAGGIKALEEATLFPRVSGKLLKNVLKEGDSVKKGETVSLIERDEVGAVYEPVVVPSTINGVVGRTYLDAGANVTLTTPVAFVVNQSTVRILLDIPERYVSQIYKGQAATFKVDSLPQVFNGTVNVVSPVVDSVTRAMAVEVWADNSAGLLKSGMFAKVNIVLAEKKDAVSVSTANIFKDENGNSFVLVTAEDKAAKREIKLGFIDGDYMEVAEGLAPGDSVINAVFGLKDGGKIKVIGQ